MKAVASLPLDRLWEVARATEGTYEAIRLNEVRWDFVTKAEDGSPTFLLHDASDRRLTPGYELAHLSVEFNVACRVRVDGKCFESRFAVVSCDAGVVDLHELFVKTVAAAVESLTVSAGTDEINACLQTLFSLFRNLCRPTAREVSGLWAELLVIDACGYPSAALGAWHSDLYERHDFSLRDVRVEVKASRGELRCHEFALQQLYVKPPLQGKVISLLLREAAGGTGLMDLAKGIEARLANSPVLQRKLWSNIVSALGVDFSNALDRRFDRAHALETMRVFDMDQVPSIGRDVDARVSEIRFVSDLSGIAPPLQDVEMALRGLFG